MSVVLRKNFMCLLVSEPVLVFSGTVTNSKIHNRYVDRSAILSEVDSALRESILDQVKLYKFSNIRNREVKRNTHQTLKANDITVFDSSTCTDFIQCVCFTLI
jgi:hypothetical protein